MFSNTVKVVTSQSGNPIVSDASLIDVSSGKSTRRVILNASTVLDFKIANASSTENGPAGSTRYNIRVDVRETVQNEDGKYSVITTSAYLVLVQPKASADYANVNKCVNTLLGFLCMADGDLGEYLGNTAGSFNIGPNTVLASNSAIKRVIGGEL